MEYGGVRLQTATYLEKTRIPVTIDIGFGDAMADATQRLDFSTLLDFPVPQVHSQATERRYATSCSRSPIIRPTGGSLPAFHRGSASSW